MKGLARGQRASGDLIPWTIAQQVRECGCGCSRCVYVGVQGGCDRSLGECVFLGVCKSLCRCVCHVVCGRRWC